MHQMHFLRKPLCASGAVEAQWEIDRMHLMPSVKKKKPTLKLTFLRAWRLHRKMTLNEACLAFDMDDTNLGRIERGIVPYNQSVIEAAAELYKCGVGDILERDPKDLETITEIWSRASDDQKDQILTVARALSAR